MWNAQNSGGDDRDAASSHDDDLESESGVGSDRQEASVGHVDDEDGEGAVDEDDDEEEDDDDVDEEDVKVGLASATKTEDDEDDDDDEEDDASSAAPTAAPLVPRGKPESMAARLAVAQLAAKREEELEEMETEVVAEATVDGDEDDDSVVVEAVVEDTVGGVLVSATKSPKKSAPKKPKKKLSRSPAFSPPANRGELLINEEAPPVTSVEYENLESLMEHFCRVPLLAEFSRPVSLLHPELMAAYSKIVSHPVDLGHVCRGIRRRQYKCTRDVRLDIWRVFANCVKFHSHPNNKHAVPSFVSIALHLREFFNNLWQEYMLPSELPDKASEMVRVAFEKREVDRKKRLENSGVLVLSKSHSTKTAVLLGQFIQNGGCVDKLDVEPVFGDRAKIQDPDLDTVVSKLRTLQQHLSDLDTEYPLDKYYKDLMKCCTEEVLEDNSALRNRILIRLNRFLWKRCVPLHEANSRGVTQSSVWGNIATTIWARESSKKAFWPALCLGILPPEEQREGWHAAVTERNELRLPEKLRAQLMASKKKCEQGQKRLNLSFFLVEFLGTHEFIWVRETDIVEKFDPDDDPNKNPPPGGAKKKQRVSRSGISSVVNSKLYGSALEECVWATEEYEGLLQEAVEYDSDNDAVEEGEELNYSYSLLSQSDDEADEEDAHGFMNEETDMSPSDVDEANWLLSHEGMLDTSATGRKNAKKRAQALKKQATGKDKKESTDTTSKKAKPGVSKKKKQSKAMEREEKKELRDLEKRRKKRMREREKALRNEARKNKRRRTSSSPESDDDERGLNRDKRSRATAIVKAYMTRMSQTDDYKSLALGGVMTMPAAMVDSTGLLGMTLAFRAAAGELAMPDEGDQQLARLKPWIAIDTKKPKTAHERAQNLEKQVVLLEKEIERVRANTERRKELTVSALKQRALLNAQIEVDDVAARHNHYKKRVVKKVSPKPEQGIDDTAEEDGSPGAKRLSGEFEEVRADAGEDTEAEPTNGDAVETVEAEAMTASANGDDVQE